MRPTDLKEILKREPFEPVQIGLSDGRSILIRHPDQVVISDRQLIVGLAHVRRSRPLRTPDSDDAIAKDWIMVSLLHVVTAEPANGRRVTTKRKRKKRRG